jgi:hypothetical protein
MFGFSVNFTMKLFTPGTAAGRNHSHSRSSVNIHTVFMLAFVRAVGGSLGRAAAGRIVLAVSLNGASASHLQKEQLHRQVEGELSSKPSMV